jgi:hypothetical protein
LGSKQQRRISFFVIFATFLFIPKKYEPIIPGNDGLGISSLLVEDDSSRISVSDAKYKSTGITTELDLIIDFILDMLSIVSLNCCEWMAVLQY